MSPLANAAFAILLALSPLSARREALPGWAETADARAWRYASIAADVATAVEDACAGRAGCERWALPLVLGIAWHESGFAADTESPDGCYRGHDGRGPRCDGGRAATMFQMQGSREERALWLGDRVAATREALRRALRSWSACRALPVDARLSAYAGGRCSSEGRAAAASRELWRAREQAARAMR